MFKKRKIVLTALPVLAALLLAGTMSLSNKLYEVSAEGEAHNHSGYTLWDNSTQLPNNPGSYVLSSDITLSSTWYVPAGTTNLCLNGHIIKTNGDTIRLISIDSGSVFNLYDCNVGNEAPIVHNGYLDSTGLWHLDSDNSHILGNNETVKTITGGIITGGYVTDNNFENGGGAIYNNGVFTMNGGNIAGCICRTNGGGVFNKNSFTMNGGSILGCKTLSTESSRGLGGGVYVYNGASFTLSGGTIEYNTASRHGGGVQNCGSGTFVMTGGSIINNSAATKGGGGINSDGVLKISDGTITNNTAIIDGGGIRFNGGSSRTFIIGGATKIINNTSGEAGQKVSNNLYMSNGSKIELGSGTSGGNEFPTPTSDMSIGLTLQSKTGQFSITGVADYSSNFFSDNSKYYVKYNVTTSGSEYLELYQTTIADIMNSLDTELDQKGKSWTNSDYTMYMMVENNDYLSFCFDDDGSIQENISLNEIVTVNGNTYTATNGTATFTFNMENNILSSVTVSNSTKNLNGTFVERESIADMLNKANNFPNSRENGWQNGDLRLFTSMVGGNEMLTLYSPSSSPDDIPLGPTSAKLSGFHESEFASGVISYEILDGELVSITFTDIDPTMDGKFSSHTHSYGSVKATWNNSMVTLSVTCACGDVQSTTLQGNYEKLTDATYTEKETGKYTLTVAEGIFAGTYESQVVEVGELLIQPEKNTLSSGAIVGITLGSIFGLLVIIFVVLYILWRHKDFNVPVLCIVLTPAFRFINKLLFRTKLNKVELEKEEKNNSNL